MSFLIERARPEMASALTTIAFEAKASWGYPREWLEVWRSTLTICPEYIVSHSVFVAISTSSADESWVLGLVALEDHSDHFSLGHLWVRPAAQKRGVGRRLVEHVLGDARAVAPGRGVRVESDPNAAGFYARMGATRIGYVPAPVAGDSGRTLPLFEFKSRTS